MSSLNTMFLITGLAVGAIIAWWLTTRKTSTTTIDLSNKLDSARDEVLRQKVETEVLRTRLENEQKSAQEKLDLLALNRDQLKSDFENLANRIFEEKGKSFTEQNKTNMDSILTPLREQLGDFKKKVEDVYDKESRDRTTLFNEISRLKDLNQQISRDAVNLTNALKGESKTQGNWGEVILERILEQSGLEKGREYEVQVKSHDEDGSRRAPDVIVRLPDGKDIVIDAKVTLTAYERYCSAESDTEREQALKEHLTSMINHLKNLSDKKYEELTELRTLDFVLMFIPVDGALHLAVSSDPGLFNRAMEKNIIMVTPSNLLATLRIIRNIWRTEQQNKHALEIADKAGSLYDKFVAFVEDIELIDKHLDKAKDAVSETRKKLSTGKGNLVKRAQELLNMGVKAKKELADTFISECED